MTDSERTAMLERLLPLIGKMATKFFRRRWAIPIDDLKQEAAAAVWKNMHNYDSARGDLESWAGCRIWGAMLDAMRSQGRMLSGGQRTKRRERRVPFERRYREGQQMVIERPDEREDSLRRYRDGYEQLEDLLRGLTDQESRACLMRWGHDMEQKEIGRAMGLHDSRISQFLTRAKGYLRQVVIDRGIHVRGATA